VPEALLSLSFTIAFATLMFYGVERPLARMRRRLHDDIGRPPPVRPITAAVQEARVATTDTAQ
jgi:peptidoglycan/LPS O-acetylase OafA/YrhL